MRIHRPTRRTTARLAVTALACAGVVLTGATAASANPYDITGDGVADQYQFDLDGDGLVDNWWTDVDNDGTVDEYVFDTNRDTRPDAWAVDNDHDLVWDRILGDLDGDGHADTLLPGYAYDTVWGPNPPAPGAPGGASCFTPDGNLPLWVPTFGECAWLQTYATNIGIGLNPGAVIAGAIQSTSARVL